MELGWSQATVLKIIFPWPPFFRTFLIYLFLFPDFLPCESDLLLSFFFINPPSFVFGFTSPTASTYSWLLCPCGLQNNNNTTITPIISSSSSSPPLLLPNDSKFGSIASSPPTFLPHHQVHCPALFLPWLDLNHWPLTHNNNIYTYTINHIYHLSNIIVSIVHHSSSFHHLFYRQMSWKTLSLPVGLHAGKSSHLNNRGGVCKLYHYSLGHPLIFHSSTTTSILVFSTR